MSAEGRSRFIPQGLTARRALRVAALAGVLALSACGQRPPTTVSYDALVDCKGSKKGDEQTIRRMTGETVSVDGKSFAPSSDHNVALVQGSASKESPISGVPNGMKFGTSDGTANVTVTGSRVSDGVTDVRVAVKCN